MDRHGPFLFNAPLSTLWALDAEGLEEAAGARPLRVGGLWRAGAGAEDRLEIHWRDGTREIIARAGTETTLTAAQQDHALTRFLETLLATPLPKAVGDLPAGSRFLADGTVELPSGGAARAAWRAAATGVEIDRGPGTVPVIERFDRLGIAILSADATDSGSN